MDTTTLIDIFIRTETYEAARYRRYQVCDSPHPHRPVTPTIPDGNISHSWRRLQQTSPGWTVQRSISGTHPYIETLILYPPCSFFHSKCHFLFLMKRITTILQKYVKKNAASHSYTGTSMTYCWWIIQTLRINWIRGILMNLRLKTRQGSTLLLHTSWIAVATASDRPKSASNRCVIEVSGDVFLCWNFAFYVFCLYLGFCHRAESYHLLFSLYFLFMSSIFHFRPPMVFVSHR